MNEEERAPGGDERKLATILFADLVGFTELAGAQDAERTRAMLDRFYDAMTDEIEGAGGTVEKFAGDAVMAAFGVPVAQEDHVERALHAALAMRRRLEERFGDRLALRIGVNTGEVIVGRARAQSSFVTGDAVNVAARLEQNAASGEILVGERAATLVSGAFEFDRPRRIEAKGKSQGVPCRRLLRALSVMRPRGLQGRPRALVGREHELTLLVGAYEETSATGRPSLVTVTGEAGVGKSRLVGELWAYLGRAAPGTLRRTGRCPPYGRALRYRPIGDVLREHFGLMETDAPERVLDRLGDRRILGLALGLDVAGELHPIVARDRLHDAWLAFVQELAAERPLVLLVEDLHWAEEPLLELLARLLTDVRAPVLVVGTGRPEFLERAATWRGDSIRLEPLGPADVERWIGELIPGEAPDVLRRFLAAAEGNPLFLEELAAALLERGVLRPDGSFETERLRETADLPDSLQALIAARIDLLPSTEKAALQAASVVGRSFWPGALPELAGAEPDLRLLEQRDFVRRRPASSLDGEGEFIFKHALTREVAYASLTRRDRAHLHAAFASWLEQRVGERDEHAGALAQHYASAVRPEDVDLAWENEPSRYEEVRSSAVRWLRRAAELATARYEIDDALGLLKNALELEPSEKGRIDILKETAQVHMLRFDAAGFRRAMEQALELGPHRQLEAEIYARLAYYGLGRPYVWKEQPPRELSEDWLARALERSDPGTIARGYAALAKAFADPDHEAEARAAESRAIGEALADQRLVAFSGEARVHAATERRRYREAREWADRALEDARRLGDPGYELHQNWNAGFVYLRAGLIAEARRFAAIADRLVPSLTAHDEVHVVALHAVIGGALGAWDELAELSRRAEVASAANRDFPCQFNWRTLLVCALGPAHLGDDSETRRLEEVARDSVVVFGPPEREPALLRLALLRGDLAAAERILTALPATGDTFGVEAPAARLDALAALGDKERTEAEATPFLEEESYYRPFALRALGHVREDEAMLAHAAAAFEAMGLVWRAEETRALLDASTAA
jgi:class 3 adenylate cyclase